MEETEYKRRIALHIDLQPLTRRDNALLEALGEVLLQRRST